MLQLEFRYNENEKKVHITDWFSFLDFELTEF